MTKTLVCVLARRRRTTKEGIQKIFSICLAFFSLKHWTSAKNFPEIKQCRIQKHCFATQNFFATKDCFLFPTTAHKRQKQQRNVVVYRFVFFAIPLLYRRLYQNHRTDMSGRTRITSVLRHNCQIDNSTQYHHRTPRAQNGSVTILILNRSLTDFLVQKRSSNERSM